jgi:hypothetical protein
MIRVTIEYYDSAAFETQLRVEKELVFHTYNSPEHILTCLDDAVKAAHEQMKQALTKAPE